MGRKSLEKIKLFVNKYWFGICIVLILILASFLRFYNYDNRWALAHDQARDALIAREALRQHKLPILGPFSQAGSFVMGPIWYWMLTAVTAVYPYSVLTPWVALTLSYVAVVYLMVLIGKEIEGKWLGLALGILTAVSPSQIAQSADLTNPSGVAIFSALAIYFSIKYLKTEKNLFLFLFPLSVSMAINTHLQAIGLFVLIPIVLILAKPSFKNLIFLLTGFILPFIPLILFDIKHNFYDTRGIIDFYLYGQYRIYVPNRWLTYVGSYWPSAWSYIIGGQRISGYIIVILLSVVTLYTFLKKKMTKPLLSIIITFLLIVIILRYYRGERFDGYLIFIHPLVIILTGWTVFNISKLNKVLGFLIIILLVIGSMKVNRDIILRATNHTSYQSNYWSNVLVRTYPNKKFRIYDFKQKYTSASFPLSLYLDLRNKIDDNGTKIGIVIATPGAYFVHPLISGQKGGWELLDLSSSSSAALAEEGWFIVNPSAIYHATEDWYVGKKL